MTHEDSSRWQRNVISVAWTTFVFLIGILVGVLVAAPVYAFRPTAELTTLIGSAFGASITVAGAIWVAKRSEIRARKAVKKTAYDAAKMVKRSWNDLDEAHSRLLQLAEGARDTDGASDELHGKFVALWASADVVLKQLKYLKPVYHASGPTMAVAHFHLCGHIELIHRFSESGGQKLRNSYYGRVQYEIEDLIREIRGFHKDINATLDRI